MKKTLLSTIVLFALAACGGGKQADKTAETAAPAASGAAAASGVAANALPETKELRIFNWSNYVDESTVKDFEKIKV